MTSQNFGRLCLGLTAATGISYCMYRQTSTPKEVKIHSKSVFTGLDRFTEQKTQEVGLKAIDILMVIEDINIEGIKYERWNDNL